MENLWFEIYMERDWNLNINSEELYGENYGVHGLSPSSRM